jgi:hypothetical protein
VTGVQTCALPICRGAEPAAIGIVIEVQQGMVNRGADISWLSQYPHEREILCERARDPL